MATNALVVWWYLWRRERNGMAALDATSSDTIPVTFQNGGEDPAESVRFAPLTALTCFNTTLRDADADDEDGEGGDEDGPYESRYGAWKRGLSAHHRAFVEHEEEKARHCSGLLYRFNRPLWGLIDQALSATMAERVEAGLAEGRLEMRVVDRFYDRLRRGRELRFTRTDEPPQQQPPPPGALDTAEDADWQSGPLPAGDEGPGNRKVYGGVTLRHNPLLRGGGPRPLAVSKSGRVRRRACRYGKTPRLRVYAPAANAPHAEVVPRGAAGGGDGMQRGRRCVDPCQLWPRAGYVGSPWSYLQ